MIRMLPRILIATAVIVGIAAPASATPMTYTFEAPNFLAAQTTPLLGRAPNVNPGTFLTDFTSSSPDPTSFFVDNFQANSLFAGQSLVESFSPLGDLVLTFNTPVYSLTVDFGLNLLFNSAPGVFRLTTPVGVVNQSSGNFGPSFQGGVLSFASVTPFLSARVTAFNAAGAPIAFAIDNLTLNTAPVPEPATMALVLTGLGLVAGRRRKR